MRLELMYDLFVSVIVAADHAIIWYFLAVNSFYALLLLLAVPEIWKHWNIDSCC